MDTVQFPARVYQVCRWLFTVLIVLYAAFMLLVSAGVYYGVPLAVTLDSIFNFNWNNVVIVILLALIGLMIQFHVFWHEEQEKQAKP